jgi:PAS domain S-box-containing protein
MAAALDLRALFDAIGDAVIVCDAAGVVIFWNPAAERMFGHTQAEAMGQRMDMIIPERLRKRHWEGYDKSMETGITKYGHDVLRVPAVDKAGRSMSIAFTVCMLVDDAGKVTACASVIRDESARFAEDRALRKRLAELEAMLPAAPPAGAGA